MRAGAMPLPLAGHEEIEEAEIRRLADPGVHLGKADLNRLSDRDDVQDEPAVSTSISFRNRKMPAVQPRLSSLAIVVRRRARPVQRSALSSATTGGYFLYEASPTQMSHHPAHLENLLRNRIVDRR